MASKQLRFIAILSISFSLLSACTCLSCSDCKSLRAGMISRSTFEAKCLATRLYEKCLKSAGEGNTKCSDKEDLLKEVEGVLQEMTKDNYICKSDHLTLRRLVADHHPHFGILAAMVEDNEKKPDTEKKQSAVSYTPSITGLYITMGIWSATVLATVTGIVIACVRYRSRQEEEKRKERQNAVLESNTPSLPGYDRAHANTHF